MFDLDLAFPFTLGLVAAFNPCGFAMLPVYLTYFMGQDSDEESNAGRNILRGLTVGGVLTLGFVIVFGLFGLLTSTVLNQGTILEYTPWVTFGLGFLLVPLGLVMLFGYEPKINSPRLQKGGKTQGLGSMFMFGVSYAVVSLGCTAPIFIGALTTSFTSDGILDGSAVFLAYAIGMGSVVMTLTLAVALARTSVANNMRKVLPWVNRISGGLLVLGGAYLTVYGWYEIRILRWTAASGDELPNNRVVQWFEQFQADIQNWISRTGPTRIGVALLLIIVFALLYGLRSSMGKDKSLIAFGALGLTYLALELFWQQGDLLVMPIINGFISIPERIGNWFTDPLRLVVVGELFIAAIVALTVWFRVRKSRSQREQLDTDSPELSPAG